MNGLNESIFESNMRRREREMERESEIKQKKIVVVNSNTDTHKHLILESNNFNKVSLKLDRPIVCLCLTQKKTYF